MALSAAQAYARRVSALFGRFGEPFELIRSGVNHDCRGLFVPMDNSVTSIYFDANESVGLLKPALTLYVDGSNGDPPLANDVFFRDGRLWTVRKVAFFRYGGTTLVILGLCD